MENNIGVMKKIGLTLCLSVVFFELYAQQVDSVTVKERNASIAKDTVDTPHVSGNVSDTIIWDSSYIAEPGEEYDDAPDGLTAAKRNPIYYFGHNYSTFFTEINYMFGTNDDALGMTVAYLPQVWGGYATFLNGFSYYWLSCGAEYRLSSPWSSTDWHLFGGIVAGDGVGGEFGVRLYANENVNCGKFAWIGGSMGLRMMSDGGVYFIGGFSLGLSVLTILFL